MRKKQANNDEEKTLTQEIVDTLRREIAGHERAIERKRYLLDRLELDTLPSWVRNFRVVNRIET